MEDLRIRDLIDMVASGVADIEEHIRQMYDWHFERGMTAAKGTVGLAASLLIAVVVAYLQQQIKADLWVTIVGLIFAVATATYGVYRYQKLRDLPREFSASLSLYRDLVVLSPLLNLFRTRNG
jgi:O-antigen/teichoic acid export membrane protein